MTFDFGPDCGNSDGSCLTALAGVRLPEASPHPFAEPESPTPAELARLVAELFREGTLSFRQLCSLAGLPELMPLLDDALATAPAMRRPLAAE